jgi:hypothetical protein
MGLETNCFVNIAYSLLPFRTNFMAAITDQQQHENPERVLDQHEGQVLKAGDLLRQNALAQGDKTALSAVRQQDAAIPKEFGDAPILVSDSKSQLAPRLSEEALQIKVEELHEALTKKGWLGLTQDPDCKQIRRILEPLVNPEDLKRLEQLYQKAFAADGQPDAFRQILKNSFSQTEFRSLESVLNRRGTQTNDAGNLMTAMAHAQTNRMHGNVEIRNVLGSLSSKDLENLDANFRQAYGNEFPNSGYLDALKRSPGIAPATLKALDVLATGCDSWQKDKSALKQLVEIAVQHGDQRLFGETLRVNTPEAKQLRQELLADSTFKERLSAAFPSAIAGDALLATSYLTAEQRTDQTALDYLQEGRISLKTIAEENNGKWFLNNKENVELACRNASSEERAEYIRGKEIAYSGTAPQTEVDRQALDYYMKLDKTFKRYGEPADQLICDDQLVHGRETLISNIAKASTDGSMKFESTESREALMNQIENLRKEDWQLLKSKDGTKFRKELETALSHAPDQRDSVVSLIDDKVSKQKYGEAKDVRRNLLSAIEDNRESSFLHGTTYDGKMILGKIEQMSPEEAASYKNNPDSRQKLHLLLDGHLSETEKLYSRRLLKQVESTGKPPQPDNIDNLLAADIYGDIPAGILAKSELALQDRQLRTRFSQSLENLSPEDSLIRKIISHATTKEVYSLEGHPDDISSAQAQDAKIDGYFKSLLTTGSLPVAFKLGGDFSKIETFSQIAQMPEAQRAKAEKLLNPEERQIVDAALQNPDKQPNLADRLRCFAIGGDDNYQQFRDALSELNFNELQNLRTEYAKKYNHDLDSDFISHINEKDRAEFRNLIKPYESDGRQTFFEHVQGMLHSESGLSADGSRLTLGKSTDAMSNSLSEYQRIYKTLPPEQQQALDKYYGEALDQYKGSKEKLAEITASAAITAGALAATPFTAGTSMSLVISLAATSGAAARPLIMKSIQGNDFDDSLDNTAKQATIGGLTAAANFIGVQALTGAGDLAKIAGGKLAIDAVKTSGATAIDRAAKETLETGLTKLVTRYGTAGGKELAPQQAALLNRNIDMLVEKSMSGASATQRAEVADMLQKKFATTVAAEHQRIAAQLAERTTKQVLQDYAGKTALTGADGAVSNAAAQITVMAAADGKVDWDNVATTTMSSLAAGTIIGAVIHMPGMAQGIKVNIRKDASDSQALGSGTRGQMEKAVVYADDQTETVIVHTKQGEMIYVKPGSGTRHKLESGDEITVASPTQTHEAYQRQAHQTDSVAEPEGLSQPELKDNHPNAKPTRISEEALTTANSATKAQTAVDASNINIAPGSPVPEGDLDDFQMMNYPAAPDGTKPVLLLEAGKPLNLSHRDGAISFDYDETGKLTDVMTAHENYVVKDGKLFSRSSGQLAAEKVDISADGALILRNPSAGVDTHFTPNGMTELRFKDGANITHDLHGNPTFLNDAAGSINWLNYKRNSNELVAAELHPTGGDNAIPNLRLVKVEESGQFKWYDAYSEKAVADDVFYSADAQAVIVKPLNDAQILGTGKPVDQIAYKLDGTTEVRYHDGTVEIKPPDPSGQKPAGTPMESGDETALAPVMRRSEEENVVGSGKWNWRNLFRSGDSHKESIASPRELIIEGQTIPITKDKITLGRLSDSDVVFTENNISRKHAQIEYTARGPLLTDLGSTQGTTVNGQAVPPGGVYLKPGDKIVLAREKTIIFGQAADFASAHGNSSEILYYQKLGRGKDSISNPEALRQSIRKADGQEIRERLEDGFQNLSHPLKSNTFAKDGSMRKAYTVSQVIDRQQDMLLKQTIEEAHTRFDRLKNDPLRLAQEIAEFSKQKLTPRNFTEQKLDDFYDEFLRTNNGKTVLFGEFLRQAEKGTGGGVCAQQALLFKVLADDFGLDTSMIYGYFGKASDNADFNTVNHAWNEVFLDGESYIYDPRHRKFARRVESMDNYNPGRDYDRSDNTRMVKLEIAGGLKPGDKVTYNNSDNWKVSSETSKQSGLIVLRADGRRAVSSDEFKQLNSGRRPQIGERYEIQRSDGTRELGWTYQGVDKNGDLIMFKPDALRMEVLPTQVSRNHRP